MRRSFAMLLAVSLILSLFVALVACGEDITANETDMTTAEAIPESTTGAVTEAASFGGEKVRVLGWETARNEFYVDDSTGDRIDDSVYNRNKTVEARLDVELEFDLIKGDNSNMNFFVTQAEANIGAGACEYDIIGCYSMCAGILAQRGLLEDLYDVKYIDTTAEWWPESFIRSSEINGKLYFATGDISNEFIYNLYFMVVNLDRVKELNIEDPRTLVDSKQWTLDKLIEMSSGAYEDVNSSQTQDAGDRFGLVVWNQVHVDPFLAASGVQMTRWDSNGDIVLNDDFTGERMVNIVTRLGELLNSSDKAIYDTKNGYNTVKSGNALFGTVAGSTLIGFRDIDWVYGILPFPLIDEDAKEYQSLVGFAYTNFCIPVNADNRDMSGAVLESLAYESNRRTAPVLFEVVFKSVYSNDPLDSRMFDLIKSSVYVDMARIYSGNFTWANSAVALFRNSVIKSETSWYTKIKANESYINSVFAEISEAFKKNRSR